MKASKGMVTTSLSWMIMAIIGTFFIAFGYSIVQDYQDVEEEKFRLELESTLNHIFTLIGQSTGSETNSLQKLNTIFKDRSVEMFCREGIPTLSIDGNENPNTQFLKNYPVYMTKIEQTKTEESYVAVQNFDLPFRVTPLLGIVSKRNLYVIDTSNEEIAEIFRDKFSQYSSFNELNVKFVNFGNDDELNTLKSEVEDQNLNSISFLSEKENFGTSHLDQFFEDISIYGTYIQITYNDFSINEEQHAYGNISYVASTQEDFSEKEFSYIDWNGQLSLPTMALFSKPEIFDCSYTILQNSINQTYHYYEKKAQELQEVSGEDQHCRDDISQAEQEFKYERLEDTLNRARNSETFINLQDYSVITELIQNHNSVVSDSCIYLY